MRLGPRADKTADKRGNTGAVRCSERKPVGEGGFEPMAPGTTRLSRTLRWVLIGIPARTDLLAFWRHTTSAARNNLTLVCSHNLV